MKLSWWFSIRWDSSRALVLCMFTHWKLTEALNVMKPSLMLLFTSVKIVYCCCCSVRSGLSKKKNCVLCSHYFLKTNPELQACSYTDWEVYHWLDSFGDIILHHQRYMLCHMCKTTCGEWQQVILHLTTPDVTKRKLIMRFIVRTETGFTVNKQRQTEIKQKGSFCDL